MTDASISTPALDPVALEAAWEAAALRPASPKEGYVVTGEGLEIAIRAYLTALSATGDKREALARLIAPRAKDSSWGWQMAVGGEDRILAAGWTRRAPAPPEGGVREAANGLLDVIEWEDGAPVAVSLAALWTHVATLKAALSAPPSPPADTAKLVEALEELAAGWKGASQLDEKMPPVTPGENWTRKAVYDVCAWSLRDLLAAHRAEPGQ